MKRITGRNPNTGRAMEVGIENGVVVSLRDGPPDEAAWLSAGLIDLQINGYASFDLNAEDVTPETVISLAEQVLKTGVTTFLPTVITQSEERIVAALRAIATARKIHPLVAHMVPGVHVEGPHISPEDGARGAHPREYIRLPSIAEFERWQSASGGLVRLVTVSPHFDETASYIDALRRSGVHVSIGHTHCSAEQVRVAASAGATLSTHLGNGVADPLPRHPNMVWAQLADDRLTAMFIADGHHLPADTLTAMLRAKRLERAILVSDAVALAGMEAGIYHAAIGGDVELQSDGRLSMLGTNFLAGAALPLKDGVSHVMRATGVSLADALRLATANPGAFVGGGGQLQIGASADILRFHLGEGGGIDVDAVLVRGETQF